MGAAFLTGSFAYGTPKLNSDIDIAILCTEEAYKILVDNSDHKKVPIRYGRINFIAFTRQADFDSWKECTEDLIGQAPVTRDHACACFKGRDFVTLDASGQELEDLTNSDEGDLEL